MGAALAGADGAAWTEVESIIVTNNAVVAAVNLDMLMRETP